MMLGICSMVIAGCYYDIETELYHDTGNCTLPATVSFSQHISPILLNNGCLGCHSGGFPSGNFRLNTYSEVKAKVTDGRLVGAINHLPGFSPMPQGGNKLSSCEIDQITSWIQAGAPDN
jgi:hypothetical protein